MKFSINQSELQNAVAIVSKGISSRTTLPILSGILVDASDDSLILQATDLELSIKFTVPALVEEEGKAVLPGKLFSDIVKSLPDAAVHIETDGERAHISCDASSFSVKTMNSEDFPGFPEVAVEQRVGIPFPLFSSMVKSVAKVVSKDKSRAILTGVLITLEGQTLKMVATDSYSLAVSETDIGKTQEEPFQAVIAGSFLQDISSLPKTEDEVTLALADNQIVVTYQDTVFINRRIEGNFPNYRQILPEKCTTRAKINTAQLSAAVRRISSLTNTAIPVRFDINNESQTVQLSSVAQDIGSAQETLSCEVEGEDNEIAFNYVYVLEGLSVISADEVYLEIESSMKPGVFKTKDGGDFLFLIMPLRIS